MPIAVYDPFFEGGVGAQQNLVASIVNVTVSVSSEVVPGAVVATRLQQGDEVVTLKESVVGSKMFTGSLLAFR